MIRYILFIIIVLVTPLTIAAQDKFEKQWNIGVGLGPTFSTMSIVPTNEQKSIEAKNLSQFHGGISVRYISENHLGLWGELNYTQQGWERDFNNVEGYEYNHKLAYLELPLLTHIYFGSRKIRYYVNLGPKFGYLLNEKQTMSDIVSDRAYGYKKDAERKIDYGILGGLGLELKTGIGSFALEGRYYMGFADIWGNSKSDLYSRSSHRVISARLTYFVKMFK